MSKLFAQKVSGLITDNDGKILPYASITIKGTTLGTNSNSEGKYFLHLYPGAYTLECQYVGYKKEEKKITVGNADVEVNFTMSIEELIMGEVVVSKRDDPAYEIIRHAIEKRKYYQSQLNKFQCGVYTKGQLSLRNYPKKISGKKTAYIFVSASTCHCLQNLLMVGHNFCPFFLWFIFAMKFGSACN